MTDSLARVLAHPLRARLLLEYQVEAVSPSQIAQRLGAPLNLVSYHTGVLVRHDCLELVRTERRRGATVHFYRSTAGTSIDDEAWARLPPPIRRTLVLGTLALAADEARRAALGGSFDVAAAHITRSFLELDDEGLIAATDSLHRALREIAQVDAASRRRAGDRRRYEVVMLAFEDAGSAPAAPDRVAGV
jgi:hypothetical protein